MWSMVTRALLARRGQAVVVALIALLASGSVVSAAWYAVAAGQRVGVAAVAGASVDDRLVSVSWWLANGQRPQEDPIGQLRGKFSPAGFTSVGGATASSELRRPGPEGERIQLNLAYREHMCRHLQVRGSCPDAPGEMLLPRSLANRLGLSVGDEVPLSLSQDKVARVRLVGSYQVSDPSSPYWGDGSLVGLAPGDSDTETAFTVTDGLAKYGQVTYSYDLLAVPQAFATRNVDRLRSKLDGDLTDLRTQGYSVSADGLESLLDQIARDRDNLTAGMVVDAAVLLLLTWFTLAVVLREAAVQVRGDVGWWRLHGAPSGRGWLFVLGQGALPLAVGAIVGTAAGLVVGQILGHGIEGGGAGTALRISMALVGLTVVGGLVAVVTAQLATMRTPVRDLLRGVPARRRSWRRSLVDLVIVVLAAAAVGQALTVGEVEGLALFAPGLAVLALALVAAWGVPPLASWLTFRALHAGHVTVALVAAAMARRPGTHRLFALATVAVALVTMAFIGWDSGQRTSWQRAALESGAARVVTVAPVSPARLLAAVREVDPSGTEAMAVVQRPGIGGDPPVLAVDSTRLDVVAGWQQQYGGDREDVAKTLRPAAPRPITVRTGRLVVDAAASDPAGTPVSLQLGLSVLGSGRAVDVVVGPLAAQRDTYPVDVGRCRGGCRLIGMEILGRPSHGPAGGATEVGADPAAPGYQRASAGAYVDLFGLAEAEGKAVAPDVLTDPTRWRPGVGPRDLGPEVTAVKGGLRMTAQSPPEGMPLDREDWAFVVDSPLPLPVVAAGWRPESTQEVRVAPLAGAAVPAQVARTASLVPLFGSSGILVDLRYADRLVPFPLPGDTYQVWLSDSAPASLVAELRHAGLRTLGQRTLDDRLGHLRAEGTAVASRFLVPVALVGLLLAAGAVLVQAAQERGGRAAELTALRAQGVPRVIARLVGYGGLSAVLGTATVLGAGIGTAGAAIARLLDPGFVDGWHVLPPAPIGAVAIGVSAAAAVVVLGTAVLAAAVALIRLVQERAAPGAAAAPRVAAPATKAGV